MNWSGIQVDNNPSVGGRQYVENCWWLCWDLPKYRKNIVPKTVAKSCKYVYNWTYSKTATKCKESSRSFSNQKCYFISWGESRAICLFVHKCMLCCNCFTIIFNSNNFRSLKLWRVTISNSKIYQRCNIHYLRNTFISNWTFTRIQEASF